MIDLSIFGYLGKDVIIFTVDGETKTIDQFTRCIHFSLENNRMHRIYFEQKTERYIPWFAELMLDFLFFPIRGVFNIITFNIEQNWEKDISAFKVSGYIDVSLNENTEILFEFKHGQYDKEIKVFHEPTIVFSSNLLVTQSNTTDSKEISTKHYNFLKNIMSVAVLFFAFLFFLLTVALKNTLYVAFVSVLVIMILFAIIVGVLVLHSFKKKKHLLTVLSEQKRFGCN